jgi:hypothetical protein
MLVPLTNASLLGALHPLQQRGSLTREEVPE